MMIGKFHKLIQSRLLWAVFLVVIVFSFVVWGMKWPNDQSGNQARYAGKLDGKEVSLDEYRAVYRYAEISLRMLYGELPRTAAVEKILHRTAWERLVLLRMIKDLGIQARDDEVRMALMQEKEFQRDGRFDRNVYKARIHAFMSDMGLSDRAFEETVRQDMELNRLNEVLGGSYLIAPFEIERRLTAISDKFDLYVVALTPEVLPDVPAPSPEAVKDYFERNQKSYTIPEMLSLRLARFPVDVQAADLTDPDDLDLEDYYKEHSTEFWTTNEPVAGETNQTATTRLKSFEEVKPEVLVRMRREQASLRAQRKAERMAQSVSPLRADAEPLSFDAAAAEAGVTPVDAGPISAKSKPAECGLSDVVLRAALAVTADEPISPAMDDGDSAVVLTVVSRTPERPAAFEEVQAQVAEDAHREAVRGALARRAGALHAAATESGNLEAAAATLKVTGEKLTEVSGISSMDMKTTLPIGAVLDAARGLHDGQVSDPLPVGTDQTILVQMVKRAHAPTEELQSLRPQVAAMLHRQWVGQVQRDLVESLLQPSRFTDQLVSQDTEDEE